MKKEKKYLSSKEPSLICLVEKGLDIDASEGWSEGDKHRDRCGREERKTENRDTKYKRSFYIMIFKKTMSFSTSIDICRI